jgi:uncharacterized protein YndB with AHSA1/START domain
MPTDKSIPGFDHSISIHATPAQVLDAFFDPAALSVWWQTSRSVTTPRPLGVYAVQWDPLPHVDDLLGRLGGTFYGLIAEYRPGRELFVADAWWLPPDGDPIGPMSLQIDCTADRTECRLRIRQSGFEEGARWQRYYSVIERGWHLSMAALKTYVEGGGSRDRGDG